MRVVLAADSCGQATSRVLTPSTSGGSHPPCPVGTSCPLRGPLTGHCPRPSSPAGSPPCLYSRRVSGSLANTAPNNAGPGAQASREPRSHPEQGALCRARRRVRPLPTARGQTPAAPMRAERSRAGGQGRGDRGRRGAARTPGPTCSSSLPAAGKATVLRPGANLRRQTTLAPRRGPKARGGVGGGGKAGGWPGQ